MAAIVTLTMNPSVDLFLEVDRVKPSRKLRSTTPRYGPGGGGINVSRAIRRLGGESIALFPAGGTTGDLLVQLLHRESIAVDAIQAAEATRQDVNVFERETGNAFRFVVPGPQVGIDEWKHCLRAVGSMSPVPQYVVASGTLPPGVPVDFYGRVATLARERGFRLIVDTSGEPLRHIRTGTFLLKPNAGELAYAAGESGHLPDTMIEQAARAIVAANRAEVVVVSAGVAGATLVDAHGVRRFRAPVVAVDSRIGAGDSMVAGMVLALSRGASLDEAVQYGVAAGSAAVMTPGHQLCTRETADRLFDEVRAEALAV